MAFDIFMKVEGFEGESFAEGRSGWIDILNFSWSGAVPGFAGNPGKAAFTDVSVVKLVDRTSPLSALSLATGRIFDETIIEISRAGGRQNIVTQMILSDCIITSLSQTMSNGNLVEDLSLSYNAIEWRYYETDQFGNDAGEIKTSYILRTNEASAAVDQGVDCLASFRGSDGQSTALVNKFVDKTAFIIMWMDEDVPELDDIHQSIKEVCSEYNITALRADDIEHDGIITDSVMEKIRLSQFIIADLTGERPNVYYEVGFAHAIGKRPILLRKDRSKLHFDLSVHNVRSYKNIKELKEILRSRLSVLCD